MRLSPVVRGALAAWPALALLALAAACSSDAVEAPEPTATVFIPEGLPAAWPFIYSGDILVGGAAVPDGYRLVGRIDDWESDSVEIEEGVYWALTVGSIHEQYFDRPITFHLIGPDGNEVVAEETDLFIQRARPSEFRNYRLVFPKLP